jgi:predicted dehydrogenase
MSTIKIGIMSFAHMHAHGYAAGLRDLPDVELTAIYDDDAERGRAMAAALGTAFVADRRAFLALDTDGVIITSENAKHRAMVEAAAAAGKWILCEKPLAPTVEDAKAIVAACKKAKVGLGTAFPCRHVQPVMAAKAQIDSGALGEVYAVTCTNHGQSPGGWFADEALSGGGATMDHTVHVADLLRWMLGREFTKVYCELGNQLHRDSLKTDDLGSVHMAMEGGVQVSHIASWSRPKSFYTWGDVTMDFIGEKGVLTVDAFNQKLTVFDDDLGRAVWAGWGDDADHGLVADFVASIRERRDPAITGVDGLRATEVTVAAYKAFHSGRMVKV